MYLAFSKFSVYYPQKMGMDLGTLLYVSGQILPFGDFRTVDMILSVSLGKRRVHTGAVDSSLLGGEVITRWPFIIWLSLSAVKKYSCSVSSERMVETSEDDG